jgi:hypothetical protein
MAGGTAGLRRQNRSSSDEHFLDACAGSEGSEETWVRAVELTT